MSTPNDQKQTPNDQQTPNSQQTPGDQQTPNNQQTPGDQQIPGNQQVNPQEIVQLAPAPVQPSTHTPASETSIPAPTTQDVAPAAEAGPAPAATAPAATTPATTTPATTTPATTTPATTAPAPVPEPPAAPAAPVEPTAPTAPVKTTLTLFVRTLTGKTIEIQIEDSEDEAALVSQVKEKLQEKEGIPPEQQTLIFGGKQLANDNTLRSYGITDRKTLHLVLNLRGGGEK